MIVKYYGGAALKTENPYTETLFLIDPYRYEPAIPSYCVWIVPGTIDADGNSTLF
jgi:hypothetical protein